MGSKHTNYRSTFDNHNFMSPAEPCLIQRLSSSSVKSPIGLSGLGLSSSANTLITHHKPASFLTHLDYLQGTVDQVSKSFKQLAHTRQSRPEGRLTVIGLPTFPDPVPTSPIVECHQLHLAGLPLPIFCSYN